jgi:predicted transcriptional regulator
MRGSNVVKKRCVSTEKMSSRILEQNIAENIEQDIENRGLRHLCVDREMWESFKVPDDKMMKFYDISISYINKIYGADIHDSYETIKKKIGHLCTCGKEAAKILNGIDIKQLKDVNVYTQCPLLKLTCIRKVVSQMSLPDPMICNEFLEFYVKFYHEKFMKAAEKFLYITPKAMLEGIKTLKKQLEMIPFYDVDKVWMLDEVKNSYKHHNKIEIQDLHAKVRQICNPEIADKFIGMLLEKSLTAMMYDVFGPRYGVGLSNVEKAKEIELQLKNRKYVTLDVSGFDNSHNRYFRQPWDYLISQLADKFDVRLREFMYPAIMKQQMCKKKSIIEYYLKDGKKQVLYAKLNLGPRLASGSTYTTLINTFLMVLAIEFVGSKLNDALTTSSTSGDDSAAMHDERKSDEEIVNAYYRVYGCKEVDFFNNLGIKLKYCIISKEVDDLVPCSLDTFRCKCGVHMVRHFLKYIRDTFISEKYFTNMMALDVPVEYFEQLVYTGEMAWGRGLEFVEKVMSPLNHNISMDVIGKFLEEKYAKRLEKSQKITSLYLSKYYTVKTVNKISDECEKAANLLALLKGEKYVKFRVGQYCKDCSTAYNNYLRKKYGIQPELLIGFLEDEGTHFEYINQVLVERSNRYIPNYIIDKARSFYEENQSKINHKPDLEIIRKCYYDNLERWEERITNIPTQLLDITPDNLDKRKIYLTDLYMRIIQNKQEDYFVQLLQNPPLLCMYYDCDTNLAVYPMKEPVLREQIYNGRNTYMQMTIQGKTFTLVKPKFEIDYGALPRKNRKKRQKTFAETYKGMKDTDIVGNFMNNIDNMVDQYLKRGSLIVNNHLPNLDISDATEIIDYRKYYITAHRFYLENGNTRYKEIEDYCYQKIKELARIQPVFEDDLLSV